jgi:hypothetical protein
MEVKFADSFWESLDRINQKRKMVLESLGFSKI